MHTFPSEGKPRDVGGAIVEMLYPNGKNGAHSDHFHYRHERQNDRHANDFAHS
jgi:hypothetical protein